MVQHTVSPASGMTANMLIDALVAGRYPAPDTGTALSVGCRAVVLADRLGGSEGALVRDLGLGPRLAVVSDPATRAALGQRIERALAGVGRVEAVHLPAGVHPDMDTVQRLEARCAGVDALIAVGSGTINDLCKYVAARLDRPYAVFGTAPSMNGYVSINASIAVARHQQSLPARPPVGVFFELEVLARAPARLIRAGLGDSVCRATAQTDWLLSHLLLDTPYRQLPFDLLLVEEDALLADAGALLSGARDEDSAGGLAGNLAAIARLARTLILSGFGMTLCGGSYPASQGEHLISHYIDMTEGARLPHFHHGERIGVTTLAMAALQEHMLAGPAPRLQPRREREAGFLAHFGQELGRSCWQAFRPKRLDTARMRQLQQRLDRDWDSIRARLARTMRPARDIRRVLEAAGCPVRPEDLGWSRALFRRAVLHGREIRDRFTFLDLAASAGVLGAIVSELA